jgi:hypothetical protein
VDQLDIKAIQRGGHRLIRAYSLAYGGQNWVGFSADSQSKLQEFALCREKTGKIGYFKIK